MVTKRIKIKGKIRRGEEWYDQECKFRKRELRKQLRRLKKGKIGSKEYIERRKEYKELVKKKKEVWGEELLTRLRKIKEGKEFWEEVNKRRKRRELISKKIDTQTWEKHFRDVLDGKRQRRIREWEKVKEEEEEDITEQEIEEAIKKKKKKKASGPDGIPNEAWKFATAGLRKSLKKILNEIWKGNGYPEEWKTGDIVPIFKKGEKDEVKNYRGITLMDTGYKIYTEIIRRKLEKKLEGEKMLEESSKVLEKREAQWMQYT
ncbi:golgin subfamily A member 6-like protein 22 [Monomorium pharaonis]|uniref:golgin subfamily A member 6-like protein 22 n=1 Tax=Monomorium pharaonis TaxID=307658 RepID=UPI0017462127|nr:golgin subfamily A member 6-like protein 22 [Monomorium pharaonis]